MATMKPPAALFVVLVLMATHPASGSFPRAHNVTWKSINFKTFLTWEPKPSTEYSYTVEFSVNGGNLQKNPHCIRFSETTCDLSSYMTDVKAKYKADVLSEPPQGVVTDDIEFPHTRSLPFVPYEDTEIGKPEYKVKVSEDKKKTTLYVTDPLTAIFKDGRQLNIRDIFADKLHYRVTYRKNQSTGKKVRDFTSNVIDLTDLDRGVSYCFNVQAYIPSRGVDKQLGEMSKTECSQGDDGSILGGLSAKVIVISIIFILLLIGLIIAVIVVCLKRRQEALKKGKEGVPLRNQDV